MALSIKVALLTLSSINVLVATIIVIILYVHYPALLLS